MQLKPKNELNDIKKVLMAVKYQAFAKSYLTVGTWANPNPLGHGLEIIPRTDLSDLHVGDLVEVDVRFYGKPLTATAKSIEYITAQSSSFGQSDGFSLMSYIMEGRAPIPRAEPRSVDDRCQSQGRRDRRRAFERPVRQDRAGLSQRQPDLHGQVRKKWKPTSNGKSARPASRG